MAIQNLRGFRDFYPEDQAKITYLRAKIAQTCALFGYEEFEGPALEPFELYSAKSSDEIVNEQAFAFEDRGGERVVLRPELTPTLARMVATKQSELALPIRWWSFGRFWRYERPQKGRGREFYQWNLDLLGDNTAQADAEILEVLIQFLQSLGLTSQDVIFEINDRSFANELIEKNGIAASKSSAIFKFIDRLAKLDTEKRVTYAEELGITAEEASRVIELFGPNSTAWQDSPRISEVLSILKAKNLDEWASPNLSIVRGFNYYTGLVFEVSDRSREYRALLGGGRYSNLVADIGGEPLEGIGMGMGDMSMLLYLESKNLVPAYTSPAQYCVMDLDSSATDYRQEVVTALRAKNITCIDFGTTDSPKKGLKFADQKQIPFTIIIGTDELANQSVTVRDMDAATQTTQPFQTWTEHLKN